MRHRPLILVVEDDRQLRELYRIALTLSDFAVHICEDGLDALRCLEDRRPDLIVLDLNLPRVPGLALYEEVRTHPQMRHLPIVVVTATDPPPDLPEATVLAKPVLPERLVRVVEEALGPSAGRV